MPVPKIGIVRDEQANFTCEDVPSFFDQLSFGWPPDLTLIVEKCASDVAKYREGTIQHSSSTVECASPSVCDSPLSLQIS